MQTESGPVVLPSSENGAQVDLAEVREQIKAEVAKAVVGHGEAVELLVIAAIAGGHVLMEGPPGIAKTLLSGSVARALGLSFNRVQFTPDTAPENILGTTTKKMGEPVFVPGPVFTNLLLADEINRTPPRTQAALLEAMQEGQVTVDGRTRWLPTPFLVVATQNPYEQEGVYALPESQLDRFLFKVELGYGDVDEEVEILFRPHRGLTPDMADEVNPLLDLSKLQRFQRQLDATAVPEQVVRYIVRVIRFTRTEAGVLLGASPRASIHLLAAAKANARLAGRETALPLDVDRMAPYVLGHRLIMTSGASDAIIRSALAAAAAG